MNKARQVDADLLIKQLAERERIARDKAISEAKYGDHVAGKRWLARADQLAKVIMMIDGLAGGSVKI